MHEVRSAKFVRVYLSCICFGLLRCKTKAEVVIRHKLNCLRLSERRTWEDRALGWSNLAEGAIQGIFQRIRCFGGPASKTSFVPVSPGAIFPPIKRTPVIGLLGYEHS